MDKIQVKMEKRKINLHPKELALILAIRKYRFGEITVKVRDSLPSRAIKIVQLDNLELSTVDS